MFDDQIYYTNGSEEVHTSTAESTDNIIRSNTVSALDTNTLTTHDQHNNRTVTPNQHTIIHDNSNNIGHPYALQNQPLPPPLPMATTNNTSTMMLSKSFDTARYHRHNNKTSHDASKRMNNNINVQHRIMSYRRRRQQPPPSDPESSSSFSTKDPNPPSHWTTVSTTNTHHTTNLNNDHHRHHPLSSQSPWPMHHGPGRSDISYAGYLLKRSNRPYDQYPHYQQQQHPNDNPTNNEENTHDNTENHDIVHPINNVEIVPVFDGDPNIYSTVVVPPNVTTDDEESFEFISSLFGIDMTTLMMVHPPKIRQQSDNLPSSAPLSPSGGTKDTFTHSSGTTSSKRIPISRGTTTDHHTTNHYDAPPHNIIIDPVDSHVWRRMYCVLEGDVLYFYSHRTVAESIDAIHERQQQYYDLDEETTAEQIDLKDTVDQMTTQQQPGRRRIPTSEYSNLSQSPFPIRPMVLAINQDVPTVASRRSHIWEKRVDLQYVGTVRSVELEYGSHAIELSSSSIRSSRSKNPDAHDGDNYYDDEQKEVYDRLVLRAANNDEMKEWLFQFLRCIASLVMDMVAFRCGQQVMNLTTTTTAGDLHYPMTTSKSKASSEDPNMTIGNHNTIITGSVMGSGSPQHRNFQENNHYNTSHSFSYGSRPGNSGQTPLSHGHGRNSLLNRRRRGLSQQQQQTPEPISPGKSQFHSAVAPSSRIVTPILLPPGHRNDDPHTSPDTPKQADSIFVMDGQSPNSGELLLTNPDSDRNLELNKGATAPFIPIDVLTMTASQTIDNSTNMIRGSSSSPTLQYLPPPSTKGKYVPPHLRNRNTGIGYNHGSSNGTASFSGTGQAASVAHQIEEINDAEKMNKGFIKLGGCSDPTHVVGSIQDSMYIPRKASQLGKVRTVPFGFSTASNQKLMIHPEVASTRRRLSYEIGAVSECGVRDYNEDSFLISSNLLESFVHLERNEDSLKPQSTIWDNYSTNHTSHNPGLFAIFDGHCGDQASRFTAEELSRFIYEESARATHQHDMNCAEIIASIIEAIERAMNKLDAAFCQLCVQGGREWDSGSTALIAALIDEHLIIASLGDARGIVGRSVDTDTNIDQYIQDGWNELPQTDTGSTRRCLWKEVTNIHSPNRDDERQRIETAGGWVTTESEIPVAQLKRMELDDDDVVDILQRCFADRLSYTGNGGSDNYITSNKASAPHRVIQIARVCGILGVSRAIGDRELKASSYNDTKHNVDDDIDPNNRPLSDDDYRWDSSHLGIMYPEGHDRYIVGNLISNKPEFQLVRVGEMGVYDEFLLLACDGLWDVLDPDDAYRITRDLLFDKQWSAKKTAGRLSELALHLGSSDNVTVIIVRFFLDDE